MVGAGTSGLPIDRNLMANAVPRATVPRRWRDDVTREDLLQVGFGLGADNTLHAAPCSVTLTPINGAFVRITMKLPQGNIISCVAHASAFRPVIEAHHDRP